MNFAAVFAAKVDFYDRRPFRSFFEFGMKRKPTDSVGQCRKEPKLVAETFPHTIVQEERDRLLTEAIHKVKARNAVCKLMQEVKTVMEKYPLEVVSSADRLLQSQSLVHLYTVQVKGQIPLPNTVNHVELRKAVKQRILEAIRPKLATQTTYSGADLLDYLVGVCSLEPDPPKGDLLKAQVQATALGLPQLAILLPRLSQLLADAPC